ncbi:hypothetical protein [Acinetobacter sp. B51(2017)]|uniref:phage tail terminator protein n=1 Tax=Acinetobacter sp. B51(2017) TaxID=2060938 RepID=UPI000F076C22|nr:hypothetical protein [Acinetobacter sp. B51(2017)]
MSMIQQYFGLEPILVDVLKAKFGELPIYTPFSIEEMLENSNDEVSLNVIYFDDRIGDDAVQGRNSVVHQQWLIVLCIRDASSQLQQTNAIRTKAQPYIETLLSTMQGFDPKLVGARRFKRVNSPVRAGGKSSFCYLPFMFEIPLFIGKK